MKCEECGGTLRRIEQHWDDKNPKLLHRHAECMECGVEVKWSKEYQDPIMGEKIYFHPITKRGSFKIEFGTPEARGKPTPQFKRYS